MTKSNKPILFVALTIMSFVFNNASTTTLDTNENENDTVEIKRGEDVMHTSIQVPVYTILKKDVDSLFKKGRRLIIQLVDNGSDQNIIMYIGKNKKYTELPGKILITGAPVKLDFPLKFGGNQISKKSLEGHVYDSLQIVPFKDSLNYLSYKLYIIKSNKTTEYIDDADPSPPATRFRE